MVSLVRDMETFSAYEKTNFHGTERNCFFDMVRRSCDESLACGQRIFTTGEI